MFVDWCGSYSVLKVQAGDRGTRGLPPPGGPARWILVFGVAGVKLASSGAALSTPVRVVRVTRGWEGDGREDVSPGLPDCPTWVAVWAAVELWCNRSRSVKSWREQRATRSLAPAAPDCLALACVGATGPHPIGLAGWSSVCRMWLWCPRLNGPNRVSPRLPRV